MLKPILKAMISALIPILYSLLVAKYPNFPLSSEQLLALILWILGIGVGGWQLNNLTKNRDW